MNIQDFVNEVNALRLANKGKWYTWQGVVNNKEVALKGFGTWLQILRVNGLQCGNCSDKSVKDFKSDLHSAVA